MRGAPWNNPPKGPADQVSAEDVCELLGLPREIDGIQTLQKYVYPCAIEICSDGEVIGRHRGNSLDGRLHKLFGEQSYSEGTFQPALRAMLKRVTFTLAQGIDRS